MAMSLLTHMCVSVKYSQCLRHIFG